MSFATYSPDKVQVVFQGNMILGFASGTFIDAERHVDGFQMHVGSLGDVTRTRNLNRTGQITFTLMAQSPYNDLLQALADSDEQFGDSFGTLQILDQNGKAEVHCEKAWIRKRPKMERAQESGNTVWVLDAADIEIVVSGNVVIP